MTNILDSLEKDLEEIRNNVGKSPLMGHQDTLGIIDETLFDYLMYNVYLPIQDLDTLLNRTLNFFHLADAILYCLGNREESIRLYDLIDFLRRGGYYKRLQEQNPVWLLTNRHTACNIKIIIASLLVRMAKKLSFEEIKEVMTMFTLEERKGRTTGVPCNVKYLIGVLKNMNRTISVKFLQNWIKRNKLEVEDTIMAHEFLYLICFCEDRSTYLRMIPKSVFRRERNPRTHLYELQPISEIVSIPDTKIQEQLRSEPREYIQEERVIEKKVEKQKLKPKVKLPNKVNPLKSHSSLTKIQSMLRDQGIYRDIKKCLNNNSRSPSITHCLNNLKNSKANPRPQTATHPLKMQEILSATPAGYSHIDIENINLVKAKIRPKSVIRNLSPRLVDSNLKLKQIIKVETSQLNHVITSCLYCVPHNLMI